MCPFLLSLFIILVGLTMTLFSDKMLNSHRCIHGLMPNLIKKSWTLSRKDRDAMRHSNSRLSVQKRGQLDYNAVFICIKSCQLAKNSSSFEMGHLLCTYVVLYPNWASCSLMQLCRLLSRCWMEFAQ